MKELKSVGRPDVRTPELGVTPPDRGRLAANAEKRRLARTARPAPPSGSRALPRVGNGTWGACALAAAAGVGLR